MSRAGEVVWERELPFTLCDAIVREDGSSAGFAYPQGAWPPDGEWIVAVLAPDGRVRGEAHVEREWRVPHGASDPTPLELRTGAHTFAVKVCGWRRGSERWLSFDWARCRRDEQAWEAWERRTGTAEPHEIALDAAPTLALEPRGRVIFPWPAAAGAAGSSESRLHWAHRVFVDERERIWISELSTRIVHAFDARGAALLDLVPDPLRTRLYWLVSWIAVRGDGNVFVCTDQSIERFGQGGERFERTRTPDSQVPDWLFQPGTSTRWEVDSGGDVARVDAACRELSIERGANRRWFQDLTSAAVGPDGALAVFDEPNPWISSRDPSTWVHLFAADGEALRSIQVPDRFTWAKIACDERRIALLSGRELLLFTRDGAPLGRARLPEELEHASIFFSSSEHELWAFVHYRPEMWRFALPE
jgi:hypothetical protein